MSIGIRKLVQNPAKFNLINSEDLKGSKYGIVKDGNLYVSPAMFTLIKYDEKKASQGVLKSLEVYFPEHNESVAIAAQKLLKLSKEERSRWD